jgi:hypothetical protein
MVICWLTICRSQFSRYLKGNYDSGLRFWRACSYFLPLDYILFNIFIFYFWVMYGDHLCGLVVRVPGYRSRGPGFDSRRYQISWEVVGLERGPLSLVSTTEELLGRKGSDYGRRVTPRWPRDALYPQKLALTSQTSGGRSVGVIRSRTQTMEYVCMSCTAA